MMEQVTLEHFMDGVKRRNPGQPEFHQAVHEVADTILPFIAANPIYHEMQIPTDPGLYDKGY